MSVEPWHATIRLTEESVRMLIAQQFPVLCPITSVKYIDQGWDNTVYLINNELIFRFPHRKEGAELLERENLILSHLQGQFALQIPNPCYLGKPTQGYLYPFHGYRKISGVGGCYAGLNAQERGTSVASLARFLRRLHDIPIDQVRSWGIGSQLFDRTNLSIYANNLSKRIAHIRQQGVASVDTAFVQQELEIAHSLMLSKEPQVLVHGDLYCKHLLFAGKRLTGIIDWGDGGINHPVIDLAVVHGFYPLGCHDAFLQLYGPVDESSWAYARFLAIYYGYTLLWYATNQGDTMLLHEALQSLQRLGARVVLLSSDA